MLFVACKKDDGDTSLAPEEQIQNKKFKIVDQSLIIGDSLINIFPFLDSCSRDDLIQFDRFETGSYSEGATKCFPQNADNTPFNWRFLYGGNRLILTSRSTGADTIDVLINDGTTLELQYKEDDTTFLRNTYLNILQ